MAGTGIIGTWVAEYTETDGVASYEEGRKLDGKLRIANRSLTNNNAELWGNNGLAEIVSGVSGGNLVLQMTHITPEEEAFLLNKEYVPAGSLIETDAKTLITGNRTAPYLGIGFIITKLENNVPLWDAVWVRKLKFAEPSADHQTIDGTNITWGLPQVEAPIAKDASGNWYDKTTFSSLAAATDYLDTRALIEPGVQ
jgi:hypothetical protein